MAILPKRTNPFVPCGETSEWVLSSYGHMAVLEKEGPLTLGRQILIALTVLLGIIHFVALFALYYYHWTAREKRERVCTRFDLNAIFWLVLSGIGRYYHFLDNHSQPEAYHDGDIIYCGMLFADTDGFIPFQIIHIFFGLYAANAMFRDQGVINKHGYMATLIFGCISCIGFLHYVIEPIQFFKLPQQISIWGEGVTGIMIMYWAHVEHNNSKTDDVIGGRVKVDNDIEVVGPLLGKENVVHGSHADNIETSITSHNCNGSSNHSVRRRSKEASSI